MTAEDSPVSGVCVQVAALQVGVVRVGALPAACRGRLARRARRARDHAHPPGSTPPDVNRVAAETVRRLVAAELVSEGPAVGTGARGRPTRARGTHPNGPLVVVAAVAHESWQVATVQIGGELVACDQHRHSGRRAAVLRDVAGALRASCLRGRGRVGAIAVSVPGTVSGTRLVQAPNLGWSGVDLLTLRPSEAAGLPLLAGNDATFSALAEDRRGAGAGAASSVHVYMDSGVGGALIDAGRIVLGAHGRAGEFGHLPFGRPDAPCRCGARGCWNTSLDGAALARALGRPAPADEVSFSREVLAGARGGAVAERRVANRVSAAVGRGVAGLVNALDPEIVTLGGLAGELLDIAGAQMDRAYRRGLMGTIAMRPPAIRAGALGELAPVLGAAELAFDAILDDLALTLVPPT